MKREPEPAYAPPADRPGPAEAGAAYAPRRSAPLELLWRLAYSELDQEVRSWLQTSARAFLRDRNGPGLDRLLGLPRGERRIPFRDLWLRRAYAHCQGLTVKARIGQLLKEIEGLRRIQSHIGPGKQFQEGEFSERRFAAFQALRHSKQIPDARQLRRILGVSEFEPPLTFDRRQDGAL